MVLKSGYILTYYSHDGQEYINRLHCIQLFRDGNGLLIDLFNGWSTRRSRSVTLAWHATGHTSWHTTRHSTAWHTAWYILVMIGVQTLSSSFFWCSNSSFSPM